MSGITLQEVGGSLVINVPEEQTLIGRGQFLQVTDKRVSRSHALLDVVDRKLYITPTHTNPCFLRRQNKEHSIMAKDVKTLLNHGDAFGLLPDQLFYLVSYPQMNGNKDNEKVEEKEQVEKDEKPEKEKPVETISVSDKANHNDSKEDLKKEDEEPEAKDEGDKNKQEEIKEESAEKEKKVTTVDKNEPDENQEVETPAGNMALPLDKKRPLPDWMRKVSDGGSPQKTKASPKKVNKSPAVSKRDPGEKLTNTEQNEEPEEEEEEDEEEEELPTKINRANVAKESEEEEEFDEADISDDDYVPEVIPIETKGRRKRRDTDSEEDFTNDDDDDDDYAPSKKKSRTPKKTPKGKGKKVAKGRQTPSRSAKKAPRGRKKYNSDDDEDEEEVVLPRRRGANVGDDDGGSTRRPQRAARQKRGSYVDDPMIEEALEDFASEESVDGANEDKDSDFNVNDAIDSGSDWDKKGKKQKVVKPKVTKSPRSTIKKGKKKAPRRPSKTKTYSDDDEDDDDLEDDEPYVPRPSKRRGGALSQESGESDDEKKKKRRREPCQYGRKCYRKNPVHFRTYCHPGDSSYDEDDKDVPSAKDNSKKPKDTGRTSPEKPSRPQRSTAGTRLVTQGTVDEDLPDTYDYNDSLIDDGTQPTDDSDQDSDYDAMEDAKGTARDAKKFLKIKKVVKPVEVD